MAGLKKRTGIQKAAWAALVMIVLMGGGAFLSQRLAYTPPIRAEAGQERKAAIAELRAVELNDRRQWISLRGENRENPVLLFLAGGPGGTQMAAVRHALSALEEDFVVVNWDQPGAGKSYNAAPIQSLTVETYIDDGAALTSYLCQTFNKEKIYLVGESWGSALGIILAAENPERYHAFMGTGQMVAFLETEKLDYAKSLELAQARGDEGKVEKLRKNGPPPYYGEDVTWKSAEYLGDLGAAMNQNPEVENPGYHTFRDIFSPEYGAFDKVNYLRGIVDTFNQVYPQLYDTDLREDYPKLEVPVYFLTGRHDLNAPTALVEDYAARLEAPHKEIIWFEHSGHSPWINESSRFVEVVRGVAAAWP